MQRPDDNGVLPIHVAVVAGRPVEFIDVLIAAAPDTLARRGGTNSLFPFQLAAISPKASVSLMNHLIRAAPHLLVDDSVEERNFLEVEECEEALTVAAVPSYVDRDATTENDWRKRGTLHPECCRLCATACFHVRRDQTFD